MCALPAVLAVTIVVLEYENVAFEVIAIVVSGRHAAVSVVIAVLFLHHATDSTVFEVIAIILVGHHIADLR